MVSTGRGEPPDNPRGGVESETYLLVRNIANCVRSVHYVENLGDAVFPENVFPHRVAPFSNGRMAFLTEVVASPIIASRVARSAKRALNQSKIHLIHLNETRGNLPVLFLSGYRKIPKVLSIHGPVPWTAHYGSKVESLIRAGTYNVFDRRAFNQVDHLIAVSHWLKMNLLMLGLPDYKVSVVYNPVDTSLFSPDKDQEKSRKILNDFALEPQSYYLAVGSLVRRKRYLDLIRSFNLYKGKKKLVIVGDGPEFGNMHRLIGSLHLNGKIKIFRHVSSKSLPYLYSGAQAFVTSSSAEGLPVAVMEAMACGLGIIAPAVSWIHELVSSDNGVFFSPLNIEILSNAFSFFDDPGVAKKCGFNSRKIALNKFSLKVSTRRILEIYQSAVR